MDAVGCFQAVIMISSVYFNVILNSMLADFFPRLSAVNADNEQSNKLINEQMEMTVIIASPMIISLIACAELCIKILYSSEFLMAVDVLQWQLFGGFFSIIAWNLGVMFLAKNKGLYCLVTESIASAIFLSFVFISWDYLGFISLGIGFFVSNFFKAFINLGATKHLGGFKLSPQSLRYIIIFGILSTLILLNVLLIEGTIQYVISAILIILSLYVSYAKLSQIINIKVFIKGRLLKH